MVNCENDAEDMTDPDIMGFGVSLYLSRGQSNLAGGQDSGLSTPGRSRTSEMESGATVSLFLLSYIFRLLLMWEFCLITTEHLC
ncbi:hypothetical protein CABS01_10770 [Colletotrichum abscissum]|uniref:uncharacterized protein n=1 Tax=Colletotrichum abscissum TaxID=1671311 RepID=UPI0027D4CD49|nr:uncharacterized protein CABS01_10770 [Colletotrichum abscissum]KAK1497792.1 hypothetical protein CABS01_10770 [Colletotrichum abscissum]